MNDPVEYLDLDDLIDLARLLLGDPPIRDVGLLGSAAARPQATSFGHDAYPDVITKAAALLQSIVDNHDLVIWIASTNPSLEDITTRLSRLLARRRRR